MNDFDLIHALRQRDENAFTMLVREHHAALVRTALIYVNNPAVAEEVVQETWIGVLKGIDRFEGRSSLKTWIFSILINRAKTHAQREGRFESVDLQPDDTSEIPGVSPERFHGEGHRQEGHWNRRPEEFPEERLLSEEVRSLIRQTISQLPTVQREVITLRDVDQWSSREVCELLGISEANQRVLLHRARSKVRQALEDYFRL